MCIKYTANLDAEKCGGGLCTKISDMFFDVSLAGEAAEAPSL